MKILIALIIATLSYEIECAKILLIPPNLFSHIQTMTVIGEELMKKGHQVDCLINKFAMDQFPKEAKYAGIKPLRFGDVKLDVFEEGWIDSFIGEFLKPENQGNLKQMKIMKRFLPALNKITEESLKPDVIEMIKNEKYDFMIVNGMGQGRAIMIIPELLNVPFASVVSEMPTDMLPILFKIPSIDHSGYMTDYKETPMNFYERFLNCIGFYLATFIGGSFPVNDYLVNTTCKTLHCIASKSSVFIVDKSPMILLPLPKGPNTIYVSGLATNNPKPLTTDLQKYADSAKDGLVVVSFGSGVSSIPEAKISEMLEAFGKFPKYKFIMRHKGKQGPNIPKNIKTVPWLPQNDILAHPNTVLFITHCGNSGVHEGIRNGVPMLGVPISGDQPFNAKKVEVHGYGKAVALPTLTTEELVKTMSELLNNKEIKSKVKKASEITKSYPLPREEAARLIDQVIKYGSEHLRSVSSEMYWFQVLMWDIAYLCLAIIIIMISVISKVIKCIIGCLKKNYKVKKA